jgi:signal transduction histidine kinase/ActR/RegA family two-component response regulator
VKRDKTGKFIRSWDLEPKQAVNLSLTKTAWQMLKLQASELGISRSELVERFARGWQSGCFCHDVSESHSGDPTLEALVAERTAELLQANEKLQAKIEELTESKRLEQLLQRQAQVQTNQRQWLEAVLNLLPIPLVFIDPQTGYFTFANQAANEMAGGEIPEERPAGMYNSEFYCTDATGQLIPPDQLPAVRLTKGEKIYGTELNWHTPAGVYPLLVYGDTLPAMYNQPKICVMVFQDIRERKRTEHTQAQLYEAEQRARASAEAANRTKDEFLAILSHELRTPLNPIMGWAQLLRKGKLDASKTKLAIETIERNTKLQVQLIEDLLDISRILQGKFSLHSTSVDLKSIIKDAIETVRLAAQAKDIQIITSFASDISCILGDAGRLQQVFWNLLSNAVKFTPTGGIIQIQLETIDFQAQIQVKDNGKGINPEFLPYVFDYFRQADSSITRDVGGLGLGLAIVKHIVELHGGTVKAESPGEGQGTTLTVRFPLLSTPTSKMEEEALMQDMLTLQGVRVLAVDDEVDNLELIAFILQEAGAVVTSLSSAKEALEVFEQTQPDVLVADIGMPEVDGYTLLRQIRTMSPEHGGHIPAIALTAYAGEMNEQQALQAGFQLHLSKPVEPNVLIEAIVHVVKQEKG